MSEFEVISFQSKPKLTYQGSQIHMNESELALDDMIKKCALDFDGKQEEGQFQKSTRNDECADGPGDIKSMIENNIFGEEFKRKKPDTKDENCGCVNESNFEYVSDIFDPKLQRKKNNDISQSQNKESGFLKPENKLEKNQNKYLRKLKKRKLAEKIWGYIQENPILKKFTLTQYWQGRFTPNENQLFQSIPWILAFEKRKKRKNLIFSFGYLEEELNELDIINFIKFTQTLKFEEFTVLVKLLKRILFYEV